MLRALEEGDDLPFTWGNITLLRVRDGSVEARYDVDEDDEDGEFLPVQDFLAVLTEWRGRVEASAAKATAPLPETYRRNPTEPL